MKIYEDSGKARHFAIDAESDSGKVWPLRSPSWSKPCVSSSAAAAKSRVLQRLIGLRSPDPHQLSEIADQCLGDRAGSITVVADLAHRRDLRRGSGDEHLLGAGDLVRRDGALDYRDLARPRQRDHRAARDAV